MTRLISLIRDAVALTGCAAVSYGAWMIYQPAGVILGGLFLIAAAAFAEKIAL